MSRVPIRLRLTFAFAVAMAIVLAATGAFLYVRLAESLDEGINDALVARLADATQVAERTGGGRSVFEDGFTEISGRGTSTNLPAGPVARARSGPVDLDSSRVFDEPHRILADVVKTPSGRATVVVGASLDDRDEALQALLAQLLIAAPIALLLSSLLGYWLARSALRPVEEMRVEAAAISGAEPGRRLPSGKAGDEIARLGETLNQMLARLESAIERERSFVADASHELRTPLALLQAELELALRKPRTHEEQEAALRSAKAETDRLVRLAEDLLVLAQTDDGRLPLRRDEVHADELLAAVGESFAIRAETEERSISVGASSGGLLNADRVRLQQALGNLVDNALRHGSGAVHLSGVDQPESVELHVTDEGDGFSEDFLPHAFERFGRADESRTGGGAGLGLALVAAIAEAHGGSARAANLSPQGVDVWLSIPKK